MRSPHCHRRNRCRIRSIRQGSSVLGRWRSKTTAKSATVRIFPQALSRVRRAARHRKKERFTALLHHLNVDTLRTAFLVLKRKAAPRVDGVTWQDYEADLERNLADLHSKIHRGAYRPQPSRRTYIPKADGRPRPLAIAALEDKIVQGACAMVLSAIYEEDFLGFSYGFRPGRGPFGLWVGASCGDIRRNRQRRARRRLPADGDQAHSVAIVN